MVCHVSELQEEIPKDDRFCQNSLGQSSPPLQVRIIAQGLKVCKTAILDLELQKILIKIEKPYTHQARALVLLKTSTFVNSNCDIKPVYIHDCAWKIVLFMYQFYILIYTGFALQPFMRKTKSFYIHADAWISISCTSSYSFLFVLL